MDLWIRSQDRNYLNKVDNISVIENRVVMIANQGRMTLGTYKTEERALEVLDEIQSLIDFMVCKEIFTYDSEDFMQLTYKQIKHIKENGCVYEMPEE